MGKLKPTRLVTPRIVQPGERGLPWLLLIFLAVLGVWTWQVFEFGRQRAGLDLGQRDALENRLRDRVATLEQERDDLRQQAVRFERSGQIDRAAVSDVQLEVKTLQDERAALKREVAFLKSLVSGGGSKLSLDDFSVTDIGDGAYRVEVTLSKKTDDDERVEGRAFLRLRGIEGDIQRTLDMQTITDGKRSNVGIRFKNFQKLRTDITVPDGFEPIELEVQVELQGNEFKPFEQVFDWKVSDA